MQLSNLEHLPGYQITERLDVVYGSTVRSKNIGKDIFASLKNIVGGELTAYTELLEESRQQAIERMMAKADALGADAIVGLRFSTSSIAQGASELFVYGTAVKVTLATTNTPPPFGVRTERQNQDEVDDSIYKKAVDVPADTNHR